ncbi:MAG: hypothetical protein V9G19_00490 [Tetrasphaera sp.]
MDQVGEQILAGMAAPHDRLQPICGGTDPVGRCFPARPAGTPATGGCTPSGCKFDARKKQSTIANVAIARELAGRCWYLAVMDD